MQEATAGDAWRGPVGRQREGPGRVPLAPPPPSPLPAPKCSRLTGHGGEAAHTCDNVTVITGERCSRGLGALRPTFKASAVGEFNSHREKNADNRSQTGLGRASDRCHPVGQEAARHTPLTRGRLNMHTCTVCGSSHGDAAVPRGDGKG
jgi:hypothetical protein